MLNDQQREERLTGLGASDVPVVMMNGTKYKSIADLVTEKRGLREDRDDNHHIRRGNRQERVALGVFNELTGHDVVPAESLENGGFVRHAGYDWAICHLDARAYPEGEASYPVEVKAPSLWHYSKIKEDGIPEEWEWQCQHQLWVTGCASMVLVVFSAELDEAKLYQIDRDPKAISEICAKGSELWAAITGKGPWPDWADDPKDAPAPDDPVDPKAIPVVDDPILRAMIATYDDARQREKSGREAKESIRDDLISYMGDTGHAAIQTPGGSKVYHTPRKSTVFRMREFKRDHPDLAEKYTKTTKPRALRVYRKDGDG